MSVRPLDKIKQFYGNAIRVGWSWGWVMPANINKGPRVPLCKRVRNITAFITTLLPHRAIRHLMAPNCKGGLK